LKNSGKYSGIDLSGGAFIRSRACETTLGYGGIMAFGILDPLTATETSDANAHNTYICTSRSSVGLDNISKNHGASVRCVANN